MPSVVHPGITQTREPSVPDSMERHRGVTPSSWSAVTGSRPGFKTPRLSVSAPLYSRLKWPGGRSLHASCKQITVNPRTSLRHRFSTAMPLEIRYNDAPWNLRSIITPYTGRNWLVAITRRATAKSPHASPGNPKPGGISEFQHDPRGRASTSSRARAGCPGIWPGNLPVLAVAVAGATAEAAADLPTDSVLHVRLKGNPTCEPKELSGGIKTRGVKTHFEKSPELAPTSRGPLDRNRGSPPGKVGLLLVE